MTTWLHLTFTQKSLLFGKLTIIENISFLNYVCASNAGATRVKCTHQNQNTSPPVLQLETPEFPDNHRQLCCPHRQAACSGWWGWSLGARGLLTTWCDHRGRMDLGPESIRSNVRAGLGTCLGIRREFTIPAGPEKSARIRKLSKTISMPTRQNHHENLKTAL